jgi:FixJ family two-component response regulator
MAAFLPITIAAPKIKPDCILIDDDQLVHLGWKMSAKSAGRSILCFSNANEFFHSAEKLDKNTFIYVDVQLANEVSGVEIAKKVFKKGFINIFLTTGFDSERFEHLKFLKGVVGKSFPL